MPSIGGGANPISYQDLVNNSDAIIQRDQNRAEMLNNGGVISDDTTPKRKTGPSDFDKDMFMQLMIAQLKYQNPLEPTDTNAMVQQASQMNMAEQMNNLATSFQKSLKQSEMANATGMLGHQISYTGPDGEDVTAFVTGITFGKEPILRTSADHKLTISQIKNIGVIPAEQTPPGTTPPADGSTPPAGKDGSSKETDETNSSASAPSESAGATGSADSTQGSQGSTDTQESESSDNAQPSAATADGNPDSRDVI